MNEAHGFQDRVRILWNLLTSIDNFYDVLFERLDVLDIEHPNSTNYYYHQYLESDDNLSDEDFQALLDDEKKLVRVDGDGNLFIPNDFLDKVGAIFNCPRSMMIRCSAVTYETHVIDNYDFSYYKYNIENPMSMSDISSGTKYITLNNHDYLTYIKMQIKKSFFNGTREELANIYYGELKANETSSSSGEYLQFYYITMYNIDEIIDESPAYVQIYWSNAQISEEEESPFSSTLRYMFLNGLLTIESVGINYSRSIQNITNIAIFDYNEWSTEPSGEIISLWG